MDMDISVVLAGAAGQGIETVSGFIDRSLGVIYLNPGKPTFEETTRVYESDEKPLYMRKLDKKSWSH